jgi:hypothetical protein
MIITRIFDHLNNPSCQQGSGTRGSSVGVVTGLRPESRKNRCSISGKDMKLMSSLKRSDRLRWSTQLPIQWVMRDVSRV